MILFLLILYLTNRFAFARPPLSLRVGSIFLQDDEHRIIYDAFRETISNINENQNLFNGTRVDGDTQYVTKNFFDAHQKTCMEIKFSVLAIFGSSSSEVDSAVGSVCSAMHIPHLSLHSYRDNSPDSGNAFSVFLAPTNNDLISAVADMVQKMNWKKVAVISHKDSGSLDVARTLESLQNEVDISVTILQIKAGDIRPSLSQIRNMGHKHFIIDVGASLLPNFFKEAMKSGIVHEDSSFLCTTLDFSGSHLEDVSMTGSNILGLSLVNENELYRVSRDNTLSSKFIHLIRSNHRIALLYDALYLLTSSVQNFSKSADVVNPRISCDDVEAPYDLGDELLEYIQKSSYIGVTGSLSLKNQIRTNITFTILRLEGSSKIPIGTWRRNNDVKSLRLDVEWKVLDAKSVKKVVRVETLESPYLSMIMNNNEENYRGFLKDLLHQLSLDLNFSYYLRMNENHYGKYENENWTGVIGRLVNQTADIALADFLITGKRKQVVDFSPPFETTDISLLISQETREQNIHFLAPFTTSMWFGILGAILLTSITLYISGRLSPLERREGELTFMESLWMILTGFFLRNNGPKALSTRFLLTFWWIFCLIILITYLRGHFIINKLGTKNEHFSSLDDFLTHSQTKIIAIENGSLFKQLESCSGFLSSKICSKFDMDIKVSNLETGFQMLREKKDLGFLVEESYSLPCGVTVLDNFHYRHLSIAYRKGFPLSSSINDQLINYINDGTLARLQSSSWIPKEILKDCNNSSFSISLDYFSDLYLLLFFAGLASLVISVLEILIYALRSSENKFWILKKEIKNALGFSKRAESYKFSPTNGTCSSAPTLGHEKLLIRGNEAQ